MWDTIQFFLLIGVYILIASLIIKFIAKFIININSYLRLLTLSFLYASFWGLGIAANGGDPGFGFPAPNIIAIGLMISIDFYEGAVKGLYTLFFWWAIIFVVMLVIQKIKDRKLLNKYK